MIIKKLVDNNGIELFNVPASEEVLIGLGFSKNKAQELLSKNVFNYEKSTALNHIESKHALTLKQQTGNDTAEERQTWQAKALAAEAYLADTATAWQLVMLEIEAEIYGQEVQALAELIMTNAKAYHKLIGVMAGLRRKHKKAVNECATVAEVQQALEAFNTEVDEQLSEL